MNNQQTEREKIAAKIKALLSKTLAANATESEMLAATAKAAELMAKYNLTLTEAEILAEGFESDEIPSSDKKMGLIRDLLSLAVSNFTGTRIWVDKKTFKFFGMTSDVIFARFLLDSLTDFVSRHADEFAQRELERVAREKDITVSRAEEDYGPQVYRWWESFVFACTKRICDRLKETQRDARVKGTGKDLVVLDKRTLITDELKKRGIVLGSSYIKGKGRPDVRGKVAGAAAGDAAGFDKPVGGSGSIKMLPNGRNAY